MKIKFAGGFLPYIYKLDPNAFEGTLQLGKQQGPYVLVKNEDIPLLRHEEHHIKQFYALLAVIAGIATAASFFMMPALYWLALPVAGVLYVPYVDFRKEASAYAVSVANGRELESAASALSRHRYAKGDMDLARNAINGKFILGLF